MNILHTIREIVISSTVFLKTEKGIPVFRNPPPPPPKCDMSIRRGWENWLRIEDQQPITGETVIVYYSNKFGSNFKTAIWAYSDFQLSNDNMRFFENYDYCRNQNIMRLDKAYVDNVISWTPLSFPHTH